MSQSADTEVIEQAHAWLLQGHSVELITVVKTFGSSPRPVGSIAAVCDDRRLVGSVSGGCIEKELAAGFSGAVGTRLFSQTIGDAQAQQVGLPCGGSMELVFETLTDPVVTEEIIQAIAAHRQVTRVTHLPTSVSTVAATTPTDQFAFDGTTLTRIYGPHNQLLLIGAGQLSRFTAEFAATLDYDIVVCDPRPEFLDTWRVPNTLTTALMPDEAVEQYGKDSHCAVLALTHDPALDDLALLEALEGSAFYVGALGSKRNSERRRSRLIRMGLNPDQLSGLHGPVGLNIGSRTSAEIAIAIVAELVQVQRSRERN